MSIIIESVDCHLPKQVVKPQHLMSEMNSESKYGIVNDWIEKNMGILELRHSNEIFPSELAIKASKNLLAKSTIHKDNIEAVIYCGISRDFEEPSTAHVIQHRLGIKKAWSCDVSNACHGFLSAIVMAHGMIDSGIIKNALICSGELPSKIAKYTVEQVKNGTYSHDDFTSYIGSLTCSDAGAAMILTNSDENIGFKYFNCASIPALYDLCWYKKIPGGYKGRMKMLEISKALIYNHRSLLIKTRNYIDINKIDKVVCHQVGKRPFNLFIKMLNLSQTSFPTTYRLFGNLTTTTIPVIMSVYRIIDTNILFMGAGSGGIVSQIYYEYKK